MDHKSNIIQEVEPDPPSIGSDEFQDFESYETQQESQENKVAATTDEGRIVHSSTADSLTDMQGKNCTPSLVSSGYGSQAVSMLTLSSEDSLSLRSNEDNTDSNKESRGVPKGHVEHANSSGDSDLEEGSTDSTEKVAETDDKLSDEKEEENVSEGSDVSKGSSRNSSSDIDESVSGKDESDVNISVASVLRPRLPDFDTTGASLDDSKDESISFAQKSKGSNSSSVTGKEWVDPYSETAMEELEKLGCDDAEESTDFNESHSEVRQKDFVELFIQEDGDQDRSKVLSSTPVRCRDLHLSKRARPSSFVSPTSHSDTTASIIEESMKRNSLVLDMSDDMDISGTYSLRQTHR